MSHTDYPKPHHSWGLSLSGGAKALLSRLHPNDRHIKHSEV